MSQAHHEPCAEVLVLREMLSRFIETQDKMQETLTCIQGFFVGSLEHPRSGIVYELGALQAEIHEQTKRIEVLESRQIHRLVPTFCRWLSDMLRNVWPIIALAGGGIFALYEWVRHWRHG